MNRSMKLNQVRHRISTGYYNKPENIEKLAEILAAKIISNEL